MHLIISYLLALNNFYLKSVWRIRNRLYFSLKYDIIILVSYVGGIAFRGGVGGSKQIERVLWIENQCCLLPSDSTLQKKGTRYTDILLFVM
jgi:hypothetical protein